MWPIVETIKDSPRSIPKALKLAACSGMIVGIIGCHRTPLPDSATIPELSSGIGYTNVRTTREPWSIHVVRVDRTRPDLAIQTAHAQGGTPGLTPLTEQIRRLPSALGTPVAGINGDFYQRDFDHAGDPRGLQIVQGELFSAPNGGVAFWVDTSGALHATNVNSRFVVTWPNGQKSPFGLNQDRPTDEVVLYTPALGATTQTAGGREFLVELTGAATAKPLAVGETFFGRIREVRETGNSPLQPGRVVLSVGPALVKSLSPVAVGDLVQFSTATSPDLRGATAALGTGPVLVRLGRVQKIQASSDESYEFSSMMEQHPRSGLGWNAQNLFLVTVDGRQKRSAGMTLEELARVFVGLGCTDAVSLDGGGSATLWCEGKIRNHPCDGEERPIANALVITRR